MRYYIKRRSRLSDHKDNRISFAASRLSSCIHGTSTIMLKCIFIICCFILNCVYSSEKVPFLSSLWPNWPKIAISMPRPSVPSWGELNRAMQLIDTTDKVPLVDLSVVTQNTKIQDRIERDLAIKCATKEINVELEAEELIPDNSTEMKIKEVTGNDDENNFMSLMAEEIPLNAYLSEEEQIANSNETDSEVTQGSNNDSNEVELFEIIERNNITELVAEEFIISDTNATAVNVLDILNTNNGEMTESLAEEFMSPDFNSTITLKDINKTDDDTTERDKNMDNIDLTSKILTNNLGVCPKDKLHLMKPKTNKLQQNITAPPSYIPIFKPRAGISKRRQYLRNKENTKTDLSSDKSFPTLPQQTAIRNMNIPIKNGNSKLSTVSSEQNAKTDFIQSQNGDKNPVVVLFKPETVSLTKFYGEFMRKLSMTVLVPFYLSELKKTV